MRVSWDVFLSVARDRALNGATVHGALRLICLAQGQVSDYGVEPGVFTFVPTQRS